MSHFEIPFNQNLLKETTKKLTMFNKTIQNMLSYNTSAQISLAETLAFRQLASVDWSKIDLYDFRKVFKPLVDSKHLIDLDNILIKNHGSYFKFNQEEVQLAISHWLDFRLKLNNDLIESFKNLKENRSYFNTDSKENYSTDSIDSGFEGMNDGMNSLNENNFTLYVLAKWSGDDSSLKLKTFMHYGIPRAKIRYPTIIKNNSISPILETTSIFDAPEMQLFDDTKISYNNEIVSFKCDYSLFNNNNLVFTSSPNEFEEIKGYGIKSTNEIKILETPIQKSQTYIYRKNFPFKLKEKSTLFKQIFSKEKDKKVLLEKTLVNLKIQDERTDLCKVKGGLVTTTGNVYFPSK